MTNLPFEYSLGQRYLYGDSNARLWCLQTTKTNSPRVGEKMSRAALHTSKTHFIVHIINGEDCVNHDQVGTKACFDYGSLNVPAGGSVILKMRLSDMTLAAPLANVDEIIDQRKKDADEFTKASTHRNATEDERLVQRQAFAGMLWSKQIYIYDVDQWFEGDNPNWPPPASRKKIRNFRWMHLKYDASDVDAGQMGIPLVCRVGSGFSLCAAGKDRSRICQGTLWLLLFETIPASEWTNSRLRMGVFRSQPARACVVCLACLQYGSRANRKSGIANFLRNVFTNC